ncbi:MAG: hypothetical protein ACLQIB_55355, partial [Isosphaeraceae bacterium]
SGNDFAQMKEKAGSLISKVSQLQNDFSLGIEGLKEDHRIVDCYRDLTVLKNQLNSKPSSCVLYSTSSSARIAAKLGRSVGAARVLWARALEKLNRSLEGQE